jgi:hypothetical protein
MSTSAMNRILTAADLQRLLETFGADRSRWPTGAAAQVEALIQRDAAARRVLREHEALDRVLDAAPRLSEIAIAALADRIVQDARHSPRIATVGQAPVSAPPIVMHRPSSVIARTAALFAASLLVGVFIGQTQPVQSTFALIGDAAGLVWDQQAELAVAVDDVSDED